MDIELAREVILSQHRAVMATMRRDGTPALTPVTVSVDDQGRVVVSTRQAAYKVKNLRRDPRAWVCVMPDTFFGQWIQVEGRAQLLELPEAMEPLVEYYRSVSGEHPDWDDYRAAMVRERRVLIRIDITRAGPDVMG
jgi:PPOX class probable F420-dependent enzyme